MAIFNNNIIKHGLLLVKGNIDSARQLIKKETEKARPVHKSQVLLRYHALTDKTEPVKTGLSAIWSSSAGYDYYLVDNYPVLTVTYLYKYAMADSVELKLEVTYNIRVSAGREADLVTLLGKRKDPEKELHDSLVKWTTAAFSALEKLALENQEEFKQRLEKDLQTQAGRHGIQLSVQVSYKWDGLPVNPRIVVDAKDVKVQPLGYVRFVSLDFHAILKPDPATNQASYTHIWYQQRAQFKAFLTGLLEQYINRQVNYNTLIEGLQETVRQGLMTWWNSILRQQQKGWLLEELQLSSSDAPPTVHESKEIVTEIILNKAKISLNNAVILNRQDADLFMRSGITSLEQWIKDKLQQTTQNILAQYSYAELISRFTELSAIIKSDLNRETRKIGYTVEYLMTSDLIDANKLKFSFQLDADEQEFRTSANDSVKMNVHITGRIKSLDHETWRQLLKPDTVQDFGKEMKQEVLRYLRQALLRIDPADFYTTFDTTVSGAIIQDLRKVLINLFNVHESVDIVPTIEETEIAKILRELKNGYYTCQIDLFRRSAGYQIRYSISGVGVYKWGLFASRNFTGKESIVNNLSGLIANYTRYKIETNINQINLLQHPRFVSLVLAVAKSSIQHVCNSTGLMIEVIEVSEKYNHVTNEWIQLNIKHSRDTLLRLSERIQEVNNQLLDGLGIDDEDEIKRKEKIKADLEKRMKEEKFSANDLSISHNMDMDKLISDITSKLLLEGPGEPPANDPPDDGKDDEDEDDEDVSPVIIK